MKLIKPSQFLDLFVTDCPFLDVRAEIEFSKGAFPGAFNVPILKDPERQKVGHCYKTRGADAAIELGHQLVSGKIKQQRVEQWLEFIRLNPAAVLYCFRGGMRSQLSQQWVADSGVDIARVEGGYKALRNFLLDVIQEFSVAEKLIVVGGRTGTGKTRVIHQIKHSVDLEKYANHRGSAFGNQATPQPSQIDFEHQLAIHLLKLQQHSQNRIAVEDESKLIGKSALPVNFREAMTEADLVIVNEPIASRIQVVIDEYVSDLFAQYQNLHKQLSTAKVWEIYRAKMLSSLEKISKRIGTIRYQQLRELMQLAMQHHQRTGELELHGEWIRPLLVNYYDKMYDYQLEKKKNRVIFEGTREQVILFLQS